MMRFLQRILGRGNNRRDESEWIAIYLPLSGGVYGTEQERDNVRSLGHEIDAAIRRHNVGIFDGDEFGNREAGLFAYGANADLIFQAVQPLLLCQEFFPRGYVIKRYGSAQSERIEF